MARSAMLGFLNPSKWIGGLRRRGVKGALLHALRRTGAATGRAMVGPASIRINPMGTICNHACPMCWIRHTPPEQIARQKKDDLERAMRLADYEALFRGMPPGLEEVNVVGGGEPLVHPEALGILESIKARGWRGSIITNGTLLKEPIARRLVEIGWDQVRVSVHAGDRETYRLVQGVDHYDTLIRNLKTLSRLRRESGGARPQLIIFHVIQRANIDSIDRLFAMAADVGADEIVFEKLITYEPGESLSEAELSRAIESLANFDAGFAIPWNRESILADLNAERTLLSPGTGTFRPANRCSVGFDQAFITSMGDVLPCCFSNELMGNVRQQAFNQIWKSKAYCDFRRRLINGKFPRYCIDTRCAMKDVLHD
ncbi:radical SAM protein [bacterium]|nr:radical SAM protein [bacterium]